MSRITGWGLRQRQFGPGNTAEIEDALCAAEIAGMASFSMPIAVARSCPGMPDLQRVRVVDRQTALRWLAGRGMEHNVVRLMRAWALTTLSVSGSRQARTVMAALPRCPRLESLEVRQADIDPVEFFGLLCASELTFLRLHDCGFVPRAGGSTCDALSPRCGSRLSELIVARGREPLLIDLVTKLIEVSTLRVLRLNLGHTAVQLQALLAALSTQSSLQVMAIRLKKVALVEAFLQGLAGSPCLRSMTNLVVHGKCVRGQPAQGRVSDLAQALVQGSPRLLCVNFV
jgi:hypothetical protein